MTMNKQSRYSNTKIENNFLSFYSYSNTNIVWSNADKKYVIPSDRAFRYDLIAYDCYKNVNLGWAIMMYNKISPDELVEGRRIRVPSIQHLSAQLNI